MSSFIRRTSLLLTAVAVMALPLVSLAAYNWTEVQPAGDASFSWTQVTSDSDASVLSAIGHSSGKLYVSTNGGSSWTQTTVSMDHVASDADGSNFIGGSSFGRAYISTNSGSSWTETRPVGNFDRQWLSFASDADGSVLLAGINGGRLYISTNSGVSWTETQPAGAINTLWSTLSSNSDGSVLVAGVDGGGRIYVSTNTGASWTEVQPAGNTDLSWTVSAVDADGSDIIVGVHGGRLYRSTNSGSSWSEIQPAGNSNEVWQSADISADGTNIVVSSNHLSLGGRIYTSDDGGNSWTEQLPWGFGFDDTWDSVAISDDGTKILAADRQRLFLGLPPDTTPPTIASLSPADNATGVSTTTDLLITFDEDIATSTGNVVIKKSSDDSTVETIDIAGAQVTASSTTALLINPSVTLDDSTSYYVTIAATAVDDLNGNSFAGVTTTSAWNFTTEDLTAPAITIVGDNPEEVLQKNTYTDAGATAEDDTDGDLTSEIVTTGSVDTETLGTYEIVYQVTDAADNTAYATRTVEVISRSEDDDDDNGSTGGHHHGGGGGSGSSGSHQDDEEDIARLSHLIDILKQILAFLTGQSTALPQ